jgi:hypothetical protein
MLYIFIWRLQKPIKIEEVQQKGKTLQEIRVGVQAVDLAMLTLTPSIWIVYIYIIS